MSTRIHNGYRLATGTNLFDFKELKSVAAVVEPHLWDIDRQLLVFGNQDRTSNPEILAAVDAACGALFEADKELLTR